MFLEPKVLPVNVNLDEVDEWAERRADFDSFYQPGFIDCDEWLKKKMAFISRTGVNSGELTKTLDAINAGRMHPIAAAARIWVDIMCIHPWSGGHKRTGRNVAGEVLLKLRIFTASHFAS